MANPTVDQVADVIIDLLASDAHRDPAELKAEIAALGEAMPIDSLLAVEVLARIEEIFGVHMPATVESSKCLRSVTAFAEAICALIAERELQAGVSA